MNNTNNLINIDELNNNNTLLVTVDMINGFINEGSLHCTSIKRIIPTIIELNSKLDKSVRVFFADAHSEDSLEFKTFPRHCLIGSSESNIINELKEVSKSALKYSKTTTNGFWTYEFQKLINDNTFKNILITGCCTDICVLNLALTLNTYFINKNEYVNIIVIEDGVDTFDAPGHNADAYNIMSLNILKSNGIKILRLNKKYESDSDIKLYPISNSDRFTLDTEMESMLSCDMDEETAIDAKSALNSISSNNPNIIY